MSEGLVGSVLAGRYTVQGYIGQGRMGRLFAARPMQGVRDRVAIKLLHSHLLGDERAVRRFKQEFEVVSRIRHPNVVRVHEFGEHRGDYYLVMEFLLGHMLDDVLYGQPLSVDRAIAIAAQVADALSAAHEQNAVHRDVSPNDIMLATINGHADVVKVLDFGLARINDVIRQEGDDEEEDEFAERVTAVGVRIGSPQYMAPEYISSDQLDARSDLYSFGVMFYELLTGAPPFDGDDPYEIMDAHVEKTPPPPSATNRKVPRWLDALILRLMAKNPDDRPQTATEVVDALENGVGRSLRMTQERLARRPPAPTGNDAAPSRLQSQVVLLGVLAGSVILAAGIGIGLALAQVMGS